MERPLKSSAKALRYSRSAKGRATARKYRSSARAKQMIKASKKRYRQSLKGKLYKKIARKRYLANPENKEKERQRLKKFQKLHRKYYSDLAWMRSVKLKYGNDPTLLEMLNLVRHFKRQLRKPS